MKKWLCALSMCAVTGLGVIGFAGCSNGDDVASIRIKTLPETNFLVGDVVTPTLKNGVFTIQYNNGRTSDLPLSSADLVYVDYGDETTSNQFTQANRAQIVVVRYKSKTTTYNVNVAKKDLSVEYTKSYSKVYNGLPQNASDLLSIALPDGVSIANIEYRPHTNGGVGEYGISPCDAGVYDMRVTLNGGGKFNNLVLDDMTFTIQKANIAFALNNTVQYNNIFMQYNDKVDAAKNWKVGDSTANNIFTNALKSQYMPLANNIKYAYRLTSNNDYTILPQTDGVYDLSMLEPGAYKLRAYCNDLDNFEDFYYECDLDIAAREIQYGTDYIIDIQNGADFIKYTPTSSLMDIATKIQTDDPSSLSVRVIFLNQNVSAKLKKAPVVYFNYSDANMANWGGEGATQMKKYGDYKITIKAEFTDGICYFGNIPLGINVYE